MLKIKKNYKIGFDIWGLILFGVIMIPNFIWFAAPAPNDILRNKSVTSTLDILASVFQVTMIVALCLIINKNAEKTNNKSYLLAIVVCCLLYYAGWVFYYNGVTTPLLFLDLCIAPCLTFVLYAIFRRNIIALVLSIAFMICHLIYGIINFIV
jgi:hypothetical protein